MSKKIYMICLIIIVVGISASCKSSEEEAKKYGEEFKVMVDDFGKGEISYKQCDKYYEEIDKNKVTDLISDLSTKMNNINDSKNNYSLGEEKYKDQQWSESIKYFSNVIRDDEENFSDAIEKRNEIIDTYIKETDRLELGYFYDEAIAKLEEISSYVTDSSVVSDKIQEYKNRKNDIVLYEGDIKNIFFHSLIAFPELAFDGDFMEEGYNMWMTTVDEYKKMLEQMYERDYVLIDVNMLYETKEVDGKQVVERKDLYLPKGKKPVILSLDDQNYYEYMEKDGFADRLVLDKEGNVATFTKLPDGGNLVARDNDCIPITDVFVEKHPDFSYRGAKGIVGLTGYEGIMGYRTDLFDSPTFEEDVKTTKAIANRLKETGWLFASHSYGHIRFPEKGMPRVKKDTKQWDDEVPPIIGETNLYIYPFGASVGKDDEKFKLLQEYGFQVFFGVGVHTNLRFTDDAVLMDRCNLDGFRMHYGKNQLEDLFDVDYVYDKSRPKFKDN
ncbi:hypothetical protein SH1V18_35300 [Vallitalea longa]|uniref:NodB homology domain-containing protein n=1 Tax=Vallitalea longa TaxID=2936439 RepID=A0A9W6DFY4_9FIRM|nr:polysaccharide deacetylase family protein [Vallitalea longa]GKX31050.1 hypothetical protein SH1V18_35300 [Vallitalea longa]